MSRQHALARNVWLVIAGSAAAAALLAGSIANASSQQPHYAFQHVDGAVCLVDRSAGAIVARSDGSPECVTAAPAAVQVAAGAGF